MKTSHPATRFAPAERAARDTVDRQAKRLLDQSLLRALYDAVSDMVLILNEQRQIVFCNRNLLDLLGLDGPERIYGLRPGEALNCSHACDSPGGCGTSESCSICGAVNAILASQIGRSDTRECRIIRRDTGEALDLLVRTSPLDIEGDAFTICAIKDISDQKRRRALERVFFHDLLNTATALKFMVSPVMAGKDANGAMARLAPVVVRLVGEIQEQRDLAAAESVELSTNPRAARSYDILSRTRTSYEPFAENHGESIVIDESSEDVVFETDETLLLRVLGNMVKNAAEAGGRGGAVTLRSETADGGIRFAVHNPGVIDREVQLQIFQRSFSTKGRTRGLGAYSMKLLTERYLGGKVWFTSNAEEGTTFFAWYPLEFPRDE